MRTDYTVSCSDTKWWEWISDWLDLSQAKDEDQKKQIQSCYEHRIKSTLCLWLKYSHASANLDQELPL